MKCESRLAAEVKIAFSFTLVVSPCHDYKVKVRFD